MPVLEVTHDRVVVEINNAVQVHDLEGRLLESIAIPAIHGALVLSDGRLVLLGTRTWIVRDGIAERVSDIQLPRGRIRELPSGLVFVDGGTAVAWLDPDTAEIHEEKRKTGVQERADGARITQLGLKTPGKDEAWPQGLGWGTGACTFVPGDTRAWCASDPCEVLGFELDGRLVARLPGCRIAAVGARSLVVEEDARRTWFATDGSVLGQLPDHAGHVVVGPTAVAWGADEVFVDAGKGPVRLRAAPPAPAPHGLLAFTGHGNHLLGPGGQVVKAIVAEPQQGPPVPPATEIEWKVASLELVRSGRILLQVDLGGGGSCGGTDTSLATFDARRVVTVWDRDTGKALMSVPLDSSGGGCGLQGQILTVETATSTVAYDVASGRRLAAGRVIRVSEEGDLVVAWDGSSSTVIGRDGASFGSVSAEIQPLRRVGDTALVRLTSGSGPWVLTGMRVGGERWEHLTNVDPVVYEGFVQIAMEATVSALDPRDGRTVWSARLPSPVARLQVFSGD